MKKSTRTRLEGALAAVKRELCADASISVEAVEIVQGFLEDVQEIQGHYLKIQALLADNGNGHASIEEVSELEQHEGDIEVEAALGAADTALEENDSIPI